MIALIFTDLMSVFQINFIKVFVLIIKRVKVIL